MLISLSPTACAGRRKSATASWRSEWQLSSNDASASRISARRPSIVILSPCKRSKPWADDAEALSRTKLNRLRVDTCASALKNAWRKPWSSAACLASWASICVACSCKDALTSSTEAASLTFASAASRKPTRTSITATSVPPVPSSQVATSTNAACKAAPASWNTLEMFCALDARWRMLEHDVAIEPSVLLNSSTCRIDGSSSLMRNFTFNACSSSARRQAVWTQRKRQRAPRPRNTTASNARKSATPDKRETCSPSMSRKDMVLRVHQSAACAAPAAVGVATPNAPSE
mmetsp:Transcript_31138/g.85300  ORF Transcript_31138/g.85300 Transcript_31138/m.85300 type:complete len:289 (+) Transcript_31138:1433-2299(+)